MFYIKLRFRKTFTVINSVTRTLLIETFQKFRTIKCWFALHVFYFKKHKAKNEKKKKETIKKNKAKNKKKKKKKQVRNLARLRFRKQFW